MRYKKNNHCICGMCSFYKSGYGCTLDKHHRTENIKLRALLKATYTFLLRLEAIGICGKISTTKGHIYTMRKKLEQEIS